MKVEAGDVVGAGHVACSARRYKAAAGDPRAMRMQTDSSWRMHSMHTIFPTVKGARHWLICSRTTNIRVRRRTVSWASFRENMSKIAMDNLPFLTEDKGQSERERG